MARISRQRTTLSRTLRQLTAKHAALIVGCVLCLGSAWALLLQTSEPPIELPRIESNAEEGTSTLAEEAGTEAQDEAQGLEADEEEPAAEEADARIHVDGAVANPGVYEIQGVDLRVMDAVSAAGGLTEDADVTQVNLAAQVHDADKVHIPKVGEVAQASPAASTSSGTVTSVGSSSNGSSLININQASAEELCELPGVGEATAQKIIADRESAGPFASPEDLMRVSGIGEKKFASLKDLICV